MAADARMASVTRHGMYTPPTTTTVTTLNILKCSESFDTVGWATGRASGLRKKLLGVGLLVVMI